MNRRLLIVSLLICCVSGLFGQTTVAKYAGEFMALGVGGRPLGLGGSYVALASDASAGYWNPAGLARITYPDIMVMHDERFGNLINYDFAAVAIPFQGDMSFGLSLIRLGVDGIPDTRNAWLDANGNGVFDDNTRPDYDKVTYFNAADWAFYFSYAKRVSESFLYGASVKVIRRDLANQSATGIGFDLGLLYSPLDNLFLGANAQDITTTLLAWTTGRNELISPTLKIGGTYMLYAFNGRFAPTVDVDVRFENRQFASATHVGGISLDPHIGLEFDYRETVALRVGYSDIKQITVGAGIHLSKVDIDYSFATFGSSTDDLGDTHRISLRIILEAEQFARSSNLDR
jgi:hypothetical protein